MTTMVLSFAIYFAYAYVALPILMGSLNKYWYDICPVIKCVPALSKCLKDPLCKQWLDDMAECQNSSSDARKFSKDKFWFVQHPEDPSFCLYNTFDTMESYKAIDLLECIGHSGCLKPSDYTDQCAVIDKSSILPFDVMLTSTKASPSEVRPLLDGKWNKLYTTGWDIWPCQYTEFQSPQNYRNVESESWMTNWPSSAESNNDVWRMDLFWKNSLDGNITFHMSNEMYPNQYWDFSEEEDDVAPEPQPNIATLKTRAIMWGTEAHENWYLLDYDNDLQTLLVYYCAHTEAVNRFDSMAMVLQKASDDNLNGDGMDNPKVPLTEEERQFIEDKATSILGAKHGKLQRIQECH